MDRRSFHAALSRTAGQRRAVLPMLERHAARLEQFPAGTTEHDPEALARALRNAQRLYQLAAVTVGDGGDALVRAARIAGPADAGSILSTAAVAVHLDAFARLRTVLASQAAVVAILPATTRLEQEAALAPMAASALLLEAIRTFGEREPDAIVLTGHDGDPDPAHDALCDFYGCPIIRVGPWTTPGVAVWADLEPADVTGSSQEFLVTTPGEIRSDLQPFQVRARLAKAMTP